MHSFGQFAIQHKRTTWSCRECGRIPNARKLASIWEKHSTLGQVKTTALPFEYAGIVWVNSNSLIKSEKIGKLKIDFTKEKILTHLYTGAICFFQQGLVWQFPEIALTLKYSTRVSFFSLLPAHLFRTFLALRPSFETSFTRF